MTTPCKCAVATVTNGQNESPAMIQCEGRKDGSCRLIHKAMTTPTPKLTPEQRAEAAMLYERLSDSSESLESFIYSAVAIRAGLERDLAAAQSQIEMLRDGDTCARHCEGTAYRIEMRRLARDLAAAQESRQAAEAQAAQNAQDAELWRRWLPWLRNLKKKPFDLAMQIRAIDAAIAGEKK